MQCPDRTTYTIRGGDTLFRLAYTFKTTEEKILALNPGLDPMYLQIGRRIAICPNTASVAPAVHTSPRKGGMTDSQLALHDRFRVLWEQHIVYTRAVINAVVDPGPDDDAVTARLLRNPKDVAQVYGEIYGAAVAREMDRLVTEHLVVGKQLIMAAAAGETEKAAELNALWYQNADAWAAYLGRLSPNLDEEMMRNMLHTHLELVKEQISARIAKNYPSNVAYYDKGEDMALEMADVMSGTILRQFPERFR